MKINRQALVQFKQGVIDEYDILSSWGREEEKQECCRWKGVKCSNKTGHVVMVDIHYIPQPYLDVDQHLKGNITPSLLELQHLKYLDLSNNDFGTSRIPDFIGSFPRLEYLNLQGANLSDIAPNWFWDLSPEMMYFNISNNKISGEIPDLSSKFLPSKETDYPIMDFSSNSLSGELTTNCFMKFEELAVLNLANNKLYGKIPNSIGYLMDIQSLQLRNNNFTGHLPTSLNNCAILEILDVGGNNLIGEIPSWIGSDLTFFIVLSLRANKFDGNIPSNLCHLNKIRILDLSHNILSGEIPHCLNKITSLLQSNSSTSNILFDLGEQNGDGFYSFVEEYMGDALVQWKNSEFVYNKTLGLLKIIDFSSNKLVGRVPDEITQLDGLLSLNLSRNNLTGHIIQGIGMMEMLESLDLSRNQLTGRIPTSLARLNFLSVLDLSSNNLSGEIPSSTQLQSFNPSSYAGNNELCGPPLEKCPVHDDHTNRTNNVDEDDDMLLSFGFYVSVCSGFIVGFWGVIFTLVFNKSCRDAYFHLFINVANWIFVTTIMCLRRLKMLWS
ncbi:hypothetical protein KY290_025487 [Solanum tuberosum]|uniref:Leucine-rich repeat-containing N-terminal plant-type domain-containing protein n=1 Tax=Solanum tuberosum TaxID=4113 RepID=A0ABQ7UTQ2_SOLTU|nr:hypothetical protein KY290_025487 [Solanum tuberosum]